MNDPAVVDHISPFTGDAGAAPWGILNPADPLADATVERIKFAVDPVAVNVIKDVPPFLMNVVPDVDPRIAPPFPRIEFTLPSIITPVEAPIVPMLAVPILAKVLVVDNGTVSAMVDCSCVKQWKVVPSLNLPTSCLF